MSPIVTDRLEKGLRIVRITKRDRGVTFDSRAERLGGRADACPGSLVRASAALFASEQEGEHEQRDEQADTARGGMYVSGHDQERRAIHDDPPVPAGTIPTTKTTPFLPFCPVWF